MTISLSKYRPSIKQSQAEQSVHIRFENVSQLLAVFTKNMKQSNRSNSPTLKSDYQVKPIWGK